VSNPTHTALIALDLYAVDDEHAREILSTVANVIIPTGGVLRMECSPPTRRRHEPGSLATNPDDQGTWLDTASADLAAHIISSYVELRQALVDTGNAPALAHREELEALVDRLGGGADAGEVVPLRRGSRA
jgi:hypothetical protein